jgi:hypothetical protein
MKTIAKLMALCLLLGTVAFGQAAGAGDTKAPAAAPDQKAASSDKDTKPKKAKKGKKSKDKDKDTKATDDKGGEKK